MNLSFARLNRVMLVLMAASLFSCQHDKSKIMTVTGEIPASQMGVTLSHEHILVDFIGADSISPDRYNREDVVKRVLPYLEALKQYNVNTFVDGTPQFLGRDPELLKELSEKTGMNFITNTGWYAAGNYKYLPQEAFDLSAEEIAARWIDEAKNGIGDTGIKPGFIKIGVNDPMTEMDVKIVKAACITHLATGLTIMSHTGLAGPAFSQLKILDEYGVAPSAFIWTHAMIEPKMDKILTAADMGTWIGFDNLTPEYKMVSRMLDLLKYFKAARRLDRVLISQDAGWYSPGESNGGDFREYSTIFDTLMILLDRGGYTMDEINQILVTNPENAFTIRVRKLQKQTDKTSD
ncbi:phosphotriesterase [Prolixibacter sp. NT017]|uniref:phosphotriesterase family protein n=1 Tax=Prolixibacter sp. NT017 TaxID=2652390 RepID=UPI0012992D88|nr:phosphotriesterase [Prolixibacter sp. NT017]